MNRISRSKPLWAGVGFFNYLEIHTLKHSWHTLVYLYMMAAASNGLGTEILVLLYRVHPRALYTFKPHPLAHVSLSAPLDRVSSLIQHWHCWAWDLCIVHHCFLLCSMAISPRSEAWRQGLHTFEENHPLIYVEVLTTLVQLKCTLI